MKTSTSVNFTMLLSSLLLCLTYTYSTFVMLLFINGRSLIIIVRGGECPHYSHCVEADSQFQLLINAENKWI